jgi:hypothetical protein
VDDFAVLFVADAEDLVEGLALCVFNDGEVELAAADEVEDGALVEGAIGVRGDRGADEGDVDGWVGSLDGLGEALVALPADGGGEEDEELEVLANLDGFVGFDVMGRGIEDAGALEVAGQRELAPPSKFSKEGGFRKIVFRGIGISSILTFGRFSGVFRFNFRVGKVGTGRAKLQVLCLWA